jgi:NAD(P)H-dependent flavin oxidoreductase YrpB (nitropropane dioxygenase family)
MWGATAVWVGTRFVNAEEAGAPAAHQKAVLNADYEGAYASESSRKPFFGLNVLLNFGFRNNSNPYFHRSASARSENPIYHGLVIHVHLTPSVNQEHADVAENRYREKNKQKEIEELTNKVSRSSIWGGLNLV